MPCCYLIHRSKIEKFYIVATLLEFDLRLESHNLHKYGTKSFTFIADDWEIFLKIELLNFAQALRIE